MNSLTQTADILAGLTAKLLQCNELQARLRLKEQLLEMVNALNISGEHVLIVEARRDFVRCLELYVHTHKAPDELEQALRNLILALRLLELSR